MSSTYGGQARRPRATGPAALLERIRTLRAAALQDRWDGQGWELAATELLSCSALTDEVGLAFEELLSLFPSAGLYWARYLELQLDVDHMEEAKGVIGRCLLTCPVYELWVQYLRFIKLNNNAKGPDGLAEVRKAYEFTMEQLGHDLRAGPLWKEYISYLRQPKIGTLGFTALFPQAVAGQEEATRVFALSDLLEVLWKDWEAFEMGGPGKQLGRKVIDEWRPKYTAARAVFRERKRRLDMLSSAVLPLPPGKGGMLLETQAELRKEYIDWERSNAQRLDHATLAQRVSLAFDQALQVLPRFPEVWYDYARWHADAGGAGPAQAAAVLGRADQAIPHCLLLRFTLADIEELQGNMDQAREVYEGLASALEAEASTASGQHLNQQHSTAGQSLGWAPEQGGLLWVQYMRFLRRVEGEFAARKAFIRARKWPGCTWQVYAATALAEWQSGRDATIARNIFEKGLEEPRHLRNPQYILQYLQFLSDAGDVDNAHNLMERVLGEEANSHSLALWERYIQLELQSGDVRGAAQVEQRARQALQMGPRELLALGVRRQRFLDLWPCTADQQKHLEGVLGLGGGLGGAAGGPTGGSGGTGLDGNLDVVMGAALSREPEPIKQLPTQLGLFINDLPPPQALEGAVPEVERVISVLLAVDFSPSGVAALCVELEQRLTSGGAGPHMGAPQPPPPGPSAPEYWPGPHHQTPELHYSGGPGPAAGPALPPGPPPPHLHEDSLQMGKRRHQDYVNGNGHEYDDDDDGYGVPAHYGGGQQDVYRMRLKQQRG